MPLGRVRPPRRNRSSHVPEVRLLGVMAVSWLQPADAGIPADAESVAATITAQTIAFEFATYLAPCRDLHRSVEFIAGGSHIPFSRLRLRDQIDNAPPRVGTTFDVALCRRQAARPKRAGDRSARRLTVRTLIEGGVQGGHSVAPPAGSVDPTAESLSVSSPSRLNGRSFRKSANSSPSRLCSLISKRAHSVQPGAASVRISVCTRLPIGDEATVCDEVFHSAFSRRRTVGPVRQARQAGPLIGR
jgi:hypothetical protein